MQVESLLRDRKRQTLSYEPVAEANDKPTPDAPGTMYQKVPVTYVAVTRGQVLEPQVLDVPAVALGPENVMPDFNPDVLAVGEFRSSVWDRAVVDPPVLGPPSPTRQLERMDLFGMLRYAVAHNRDYESNMEQLYLDALDVTLQRHLLSPRPFVNQTLNFDGSQGGEDGSKYRSALTATTSAGVRQTLPYGGEIVAQSLVQLVDGLASNTQGSETAQVALSASIPLLRGAGLINLEGLISSERQLVYTVRNFETYRRAFLVDAASRYYNLLTLRSRLLNRRQQLYNFVSLTQRSREVYSRTGRVAVVEVQRAINSQIQAESDVVQAEETYRGALDSFKVFLGMDPEVDLEVVPVEVDVSVPESDPAEAVKLAQLYRLDVATARDQIDDARRQVENAKNGLLPDLNFNGATFFNSTPGQSASNLNNRETAYSAGVTLGLPIDRVAERNIYRKSLIFLQQAQRSFTTRRDQAAVDARNALRRIRSARDQVELNFRNVQIAQSRLDLSNQLLAKPLLNQLQGLGQSNRDVVEAQQALITAQDAYDMARAQLQIQVLSYYRDTGTLRLDPTAGTLARAMARPSMK